MISPEYVKQLEDNIELLKKKFEDLSIKTESMSDYFWNDLTCILPKQEGDTAYCLVYTYEGNSGGMINMGLTMEKKNYSSCCDDIVTVSDVWDIIYKKPASDSFCFLDTIKKCNDDSKKYEIADQLYKKLSGAAVKIGLDTYRGKGNVLVVSEEVASQMKMSWSFIGVEKNQRIRGFRIYKIGTIGTFTVFVDIENVNNKAVVIYRDFKKQNDGAGVILHNKGIYHWFRPNGYNNYWNIIDIT